MPGTLILIVGVPGAGKSTLLQFAKEIFPEIVFPISWTTRPMRPGEQEGDVYHFATEEEFSQAIIEGKFLEWVSIDNGRRYGTLKADILDALRAGKCVVREVEPIGARHIKEMLGDEVVSIFITPGTWEDVEARMRARAPMDAAELGERKKRYAEELSFGAEAQYIVPNPYGKLEEAKEQFASTIRTIIAKNTNP